MSVVVDSVFVDSVGVSVVLELLSVSVVVISFVVD